MDLSTTLANFSYLLKGETQVPTADAIRGKAVCLYVASSQCRKTSEVTPALVNVYNYLQEKSGGRFEVIFVSADQDEESFYEQYSMMPWCALPFDRKKLRPLVRSPDELQLVVYNFRGRRESDNAVWFILNRGLHALDDMDLWKESRKHKKVKRY